MSKLLDWLLLAAAWIGILLAVAGLFIAADTWRSRQ